jgi:hypothetical protein
MNTFCFHHGKRINLVVHDDSIREDKWFLYITCIFFVHYFFKSTIKFVETYKNSHVSPTDSMVNLKK